MAVRPGGRRYNSEVKIITSLEKLNPAKRGLRGLGQMMQGLVLSGGKMQTFTEKLNQDIARSGVEANAYLQGLTDINTRYDALYGLITSLGQTDPINVDPEQFRAYAGMMEDVVRYRQIISALTKDQKAMLGINEEQEKKLQTISNEYLKMGDQVNAVSETLDDLSFIQKDIADVAKSFEPLYQAAKDEVQAMGQSIINTNDSSKEFFEMANRSFGALRNFFSPLTSSLKETSKEFAKDKISKYIMGKLVPSGEAAAGAMQQGTAAAGGLRGMLNKLAPSLMGTTTAATGTAAATTAAGTAAGGASAGMAGATAAAGGLTVALGPLAVIVGVVAAAIIVVVGLLAAFTKGLQMNIKTMEKYRQASFRAAGSIRELSNATYDLSTATGLNNKEASDVVIALSEAGFAFSSLGETIKTTTGETIGGQKAMARLAETNAMFTKATGASQQATAGLQKSLTAMGVAVDKQEALFGQLTGAAAKYGITGEDLTQIVGALKSQSMLLTKVLDDTDFNEYAAGYVTMAGAARELGVELGTVNKLMKEIAKGEGAATTLAALGGNLSAYFDNDAANNMMATAEGAERVLKMAEGMQGIVRTQFLAKFGGEEELLLLQRTAEMRKGMSDAEIQAEKDLAAQRQKTKQQYDQSLQTITQQMQRLFAPILAGIAKVVGPMVDSLVTFFEGTDFKGFGKAIMSMMEGVGAVFGPALTMMGEFFNMTMEVFGTIWDLIEPLMPVFKLLGGILMTTFIVPMRAIVAVFRILNAAILKPLARAIGSIFRPLGALADLIMDNVGDPLKDVNKTVEAISAWWDEALKPLDQVAGAFGAIYDAALLIWDVLFGSSLFHIKESINDDTAPALNFLMGLFETLTSPIGIVKDAVGSLFDLMKSIPDALGAVFGKVADVGKSVAKGIGSMVSWAGSKLKGLATSAAGVLKSGASGIAGAASWVGSKASGLVSGIGSIFGSDEPKAKPMVVTPSQAPPAYTVQVEERANNQAKLIAQLTESSDMSRQILDKLLQQINGDSPAQREAAERLKKLVELQGSSSESYPDDSSGLGERVNSWYT